MTTNHISGLSTENCELTTENCELTTDNRELRTGTPYPPSYIYFQPSFLAHN